jgi:hypothetical protein
MPLGLGHVKRKYYPLAQRKIVSCPVKKSCDSVNVTGVCDIGKIRVYACLLYQKHFITI